MTWVRMSAPMCNHDAGEDGRIAASSRRRASPHEPRLYTSASSVARCPLRVRDLLVESTTAREHADQEQREDRNGETSREHRLRELEELLAERDREEVRGEERHA